MCGIIGISKPQALDGSGASKLSCNSAYEAYRGLLTLQHRGEDAAGILSYDDQRMIFSQEKGAGLVAQVFGQKEIEKLPGDLAIGHTRYATTGSDGDQDIQPLVIGAPFGLGMIHNGNLLNYYDLARELTQDLKRQLLTTNDLEVILHFWGHYLLDDGRVKKDSFDFDNICRATSQTFDKLNGGYAVIGIISGVGMVAFRDPNGIRPLVLGRKAEEDGRYTYCMSSETVALNYLGYEYMRDVEPGEVILITRDGELHSRILIENNQVNAGACMFEWVYFSAAESMFENKSVYSTRLNLGVQIAKKVQAAIDRGDINPDVVMPVPDTSRSSAIAAADTLNLPHREGLIKNRYVHRSFILNTQEKRENAVELKLSPIRSEIEGKKILLVDDSMVRGTTAKRIIDLLKRNGAKEIVLALTCPPLRNSCFYGIDFPDPKTLVANDKTVEQMADWMGAKQVIFLEEEDLEIAIERKNLCMGCVTGKYPTDVSRGERFAKQREKTRDHGRIALFDDDTRDKKEEKKTG